jgi:tetratricopeptide (TPR) repeat protein
VGLGCSACHSASGAADEGVGEALAHDARKGETTPRVDVPWGRADGPWTGRSPLDVDLMPNLPVECRSSIMPEVGPRSELLVSHGLVYSFGTGSNFAYYCACMVGSTQENKAMLGRLKLVIVAAAAAMILAPAAVEAQDGGRFVVMIPYFQPRDGADNDFGEDASEELRELMNTLATHEAMDRNDIEDAADEYDRNMEDVDCLTAIQLASALGVPVAICATYTEDESENRTVNATIRTIEDSEEFVLDEFTVGRENADREAAQQIFGQFDRYNNQVRATAFCGQYAASQQWEDALRQCDAALEINPDANSTRFLRAQLLRELERTEESLQEAERVLQSDPFHEDALQLAGYLATTTGDAEAGRNYYRQYLDINPGDVAIRMNISYQLAQAGDPVGAMDFIAVGLEVEPENADLNDQFGNFAFTAAVNAQQGHELGGGEGLSPEAAGYYRQAIEAYMKVFAERGAEMPEGRLRNIVAAHIQLEEYQEATAKGEQFLEAHPESEALWSIHADALQRSGQLDEAIAALDALGEINPAYPNLGLRAGNWLLQVDRMDEAAAQLAEYSAANPDQANQAANMLWADGYRNGYQQNDYNYAIRAFDAAKQIPNVGDDMVTQINFWHGFSLYSQALPEAEPQSLASAQATLPKFQQALSLLQGTGGYASANGINFQPILDATNTWIEISEGIIARGR